jgi:hypothetical protein
MDHLSCVPTENTIVQVPTVEIKLRTALGDF